MAAASSILASFPWVLCVSGPDALLTPWGAFRLSAMLERRRPLSLWRPGARDDTHALFADLFINSATQISNDLFVYLPPTHAPVELMHSLWSGMTEQCLRLVAHMTNMPEPMLFTATKAYGVNVSYIGSTYACGGLATGCFDWGKRWATTPLHHSASWHSHNASIVNTWLSRQEHALDLEGRREGQSQGGGGHIVNASSTGRFEPSRCILSSGDARIWCATRKRGGLGKC